MLYDYKNLVSVCGLFTWLLHQNVLQVKEYAKAQKKNISGVKLFGNIAVDRNSGQSIIESVKQGSGIDGFKGFATKAVIIDVKKNGEVEIEIQASGGFVIK